MDKTNERTFKEKEKQGPALLSELNSFAFHNSTLENQAAICQAYPCLSQSAYYFSSITKG